MHSCVNGQELSVSSSLGGKFCSAPKSSPSPGKARVTPAEPRRRRGSKCGCLNITPATARCRQDCVFLSDPGTTAELGKPDQTRYNLSDVARSDLICLRRAQLLMRWEPRLMKCDLSPAGRRVFSSKVLDQLKSAQASGTSHEVPIR